MFVFLQNLKIFGQVTSAVLQVLVSIYAYGGQRLLFCLSRWSLTDYELVKEEDFYRFQLTSNPQKMKQAHQKQLSDG